jgi:deoxyribodipyrimidine photolyase-related protein
MGKTTQTSLLIFPHQLFDEHPGLGLNPAQVVLVEDNLFFGDLKYPTPFHKQKLWLHRASMKRYEAALRERGFEVEYLQHNPKKNTLKSYLNSRAGKKISKVVVAEVHDFELSRRLNAYCQASEIEIEQLDSPMFINTPQENDAYRKGKKRWFMADFYKFQRKRLDILMEQGDPVGGQWSFDKENRKKVPKKMHSEIPRLEMPIHDDIDQEARKHVMRVYKNNPGNIDHLLYPTSHDSARDWLEKFFAQRFELFGIYEDAMVQGQNWLWHSILTPSMNVGLLTPSQVIEAAINYAQKHDVPLNSLEGFVRQIIGWREFMRATYQDLGVSMRTTNHWEHSRTIPQSFYDGTTGIDPIDDVIKRVLDTGYCHHIERLMVLGGFMFLCEFDPDEIYQWFMEMFVDSYDWVMVPNVYAMSQNADGGQITTKPYFSGSAYIRKMSNHPQGEWSDVWDGLYWRWIWNHTDELAKNPRWAMMCSMIRKMDPAKRDAHLKNAEAFLKSL